MRLLNRQLQLQLLELFHKSYPNKTSIRISELPFEARIEELNYNLAYLSEHKLIDHAKVNKWGALADKNWSDDKALLNGRITHLGIDFLEDDGGLSAILGVVTVRLHSETIAEIEAKILASDQPAEEKSRLLDRLRSMPEEGLRTLTQELVRTGLSRAPEMWETVLRTLSG